MKNSRNVHKKIGTKYCKCFIIDRLTKDYQGTILFWCDEKIGHLVNLVSQEGTQKTFLIVHKQMKQQPNNNTLEKTMSV